MRRTRLPWRRPDVLSEILVPPDLLQPLVRRFNRGTFRALSRPSFELSRSQMKAEITEIDWWEKLHDAWKEVRKVMREMEDQDEWKYAEEITRLAWY